MDEDKLPKVIEYSIEALLVGWLTYLFAYQNYLLYKWHRGLRLPSKIPFVLIGVLAGVLFFVYEINKLVKSAEAKRDQSPVRPAEVPAKTTDWGEKTTEDVEGEEGAQQEERAIQEGSSEGSA